MDCAIFIMIILMPAAEVSGIHSAIVNASISPSPVVMGTTSQHTVNCSFSLGEEENYVESLDLYINNESLSTRLLAISGASPPPGSVSWGFIGSPIVKGIRTRDAIAAGSREAGYLSLTYPDTIPSDVDKKYICKLQYGNLTGVLPPVYDEVTVQGSTVTPPVEDTSYGVETVLIACISGAGVIIIVVLAVTKLRQRRSQTAGKEQTEATHDQVRQPPDQGSQVRQTPDQVSQVGQTPDQVRQTPSKTSRREETGDAIADEARAAEGGTPVDIGLSQGHQPQSPQ